MSQKANDSVQVEFYEVVSASGNSFVTTDRTIGMDYMGNAQIKNEHTRHDESSAWIRKVGTFEEEQIHSNSASTMRPGHILAVAKWANQPVVRHNLTTGHRESVNPVSLNPFGGILGAFAFSILNVVIAPLLLPYLLLLLYASRKTKQVGNLYVETRTSPWPALLIIERTIAAIQIVVLSKISYEWIVSGFSEKVLHAAGWGFSILFPVAICGVVMAMITRTTFERKVMKEIERLVTDFKRQSPKAA